MVPCLGLGENQEDAPLVGGGGQRKTISVLKSSMYNSLSPYVPLGMKRKGEGEHFSLQKPSWQAQLGLLCYVLG